MPKADSVAKASVSQAVALLNITDNGDASARPEGGYQPPLVKVAVIGGGLAGLSAAIEVLKRGGSVVIIDKTNELGGNSAKASSGINACCSTAQLAQGIEDYPEAFKADTVRSGKGLSAEVLVDELVEHSGDAVAFLQGFGIDLSNISQCGGHSYPRTHRGRPDGLAANIGWRIMATLSRFVQQQPPESVQILLNARATSLIMNQEKHVVGCNVELTRVSEMKEVIKEEMQIFADAVVLATGGYSADKDGLLAKYTPNIRNLATTNGSFATGDGVKMAKEIGAGLVHMDKVQLHPTGFVDPLDPTNPTKFLAPEALRGCGGILLNQKGERFVNELTTRDAATKAIMENCERLPIELVRRVGGAINGAVVSEGLNNLNAVKNLPISAYMVLTEEGVFKFDRSIAEFYIGKGLINRFENAAEFAKAFALAEDRVVETLENYGRQKEDPFGKKTFPTLFSSKEPIYVLIITPSLHYTMGGLKFEASGQILKDNGEPIPGLFGAGEVTGGLHGGNRLAGNSLLECVVFGRIAGVNAWKSKKFTHGMIRRQHSYKDRRGVEHSSGLLPTEFKSLPLIERYVPNKSCAVLKFALPSENHMLGLLCGQYLAVRYRAKKEDEDDVIQYYSPMTPADEYGHLELVIKHTMIAPGSMPDRMMKMALGETLDFAGPLGGFMYEPNMYTKVGMIAGGTGISPMMQIIRSVTRHPADTTHLSLLYGNAEEDDILCKEELMYIASTRENVDVNMFLERPPSRWTVGRGFITEDAIRTWMPPPHSNSRIVMCGPPIMMKVMKRTLKKIGYPDYQMYVFNDPESDPAVARG